MAGLKLTVDARNVKEVKAELARLRALILEAEERGCKCGPAAELSGCPWCQSTSGYDAESLQSTFEHADVCPAFSAKGVVR